MSIAPLYMEQYSNFTKSVYLGDTFCRFQANNVTVEGTSYHS